MERLSKYLAAGLVLLAGYAGNMGYRMSNVAELSEKLGRSRTSAVTAKTMNYDKLEAELEEGVSWLEEVIESERTKSFFVLDWPNLF